ncbi:aspartic proteinase CDR1-like [Gastrolobium bilobum]|uniref:aspartic proteinase CDR1-like n=1 Tax=Gastrolobium bilobum TaxID=150636 RepID=UPI002AB0A748|nr:aspartic proteinase CDR1-like [Gastrolobium bilobum]
MSMAFVYRPLHRLLLLAFSTCCLSSFSTTSTTTTPLASSPAASTAKPQRLVSKLIHYGSVLHPLYNPNETAKDRMEIDIKHSVARLAYLQARIEGSLVSDVYRAKLSPSLTTQTILASLSIGQPPIPQLVIMDTGSDMFWVMCIPCSNCDNHLSPLFDPSKSSTYSPLCKRPCGIEGCKCNLLDKLTFSITYADNSFTSGTLGRDMLVFDTTDEGTTQVPDIEFGCGQAIGYNSDPGYSGILGLNNAHNSLAYQIGKKFSYCIGSITDKYYSYNQLILGEGADLEGSSTHFQLLNGMYYLTMEGISIGEKRLDIDPATFEIKAGGTGGVILDTGSTLTHLVEDVYKLLCREVRNLLGGLFHEVVYTNPPWLLCNLGIVSRDLVGFPVVTFHFAEGADLALDTGSLFRQVKDDTFCMAVGPISGGGIESRPSVIGLLAQQSYNVGFDLVNQFIYFQRIDCELLSG